MPSVRVTVRIPEELHRKIQEEGRNVSEVVRQALKAHIGTSDNEESAFDLAQRLGLIGVAGKVPRDLSTNRRHFRGFGKS